MGNDKGGTHRRKEKSALVAAYTIDDVQQPAKRHPSGAARHPGNAERASKDTRPRTLGCLIFVLTRRKGTVDVFDKEHGAAGYRGGEALQIGIVDAADGGNVGE